MQVDWSTGQIKMERNLTKYSTMFLNGHNDFENDRVPYPFRLAASKDNLAVISMVCCEAWQVTKIHQFTAIVHQCHMTLFTGTITGPSPFLAPLWRTNEDSEAARRRKNGGFTFHMLDFYLFNVTSKVGWGFKETSYKEDGLFGLLFNCLFLLLNNELLTMTIQRVQQKLFKINTRSKL